MKNLKQSAILCIATLIAATTPAWTEPLGELAKQTHYHGISFARSGSTALLLATHHGIFAIDKDGDAKQVSLAQDFMGFSPDPSDPLSYFASGHPKTGGNVGFLKSGDGGSTWTQVSPGMDGPVDFHQMDVSPANSKTIYGNYDGIQISHDSGITWAAAGTAPESLIAIAASTLKVETLYAATKNGIEVSTDSGASWQSLAFSGEVVTMVKTGPKAVLLAFVVGKGLMKASEDKPSEWSTLANSFGDAVVLHLAINPADENNFALTTQENAVLESHDGGATFTPFGKAP